MRKLKRYDEMKIAGARSLDIVMQEVTIQNHGYWEEKMKHTRETIIALINECRANNKPIDLSGQDLSGLDLHGLDLRCTDLRCADLRGAYLRWTDLRWTDLRCADLRCADLRGAYLRCADLRGAYLRWTDLRGVDLRCADLRGVDLDVIGNELSRKTMGVKVDMRLVSHLLYHLCSMDVSGCPEWDELRNDERLIALANKSHVIREYGLPEIKQTNAQEEEK